MNKQNINEAFKRINRLANILNLIKTENEHNLNRIKTETKNLWKFLDNLMKSLNTSIVPKEWKALYKKIDKTDNFEKSIKLFNDCWEISKRLNNKINKYYRL